MRDADRSHWFMLTAGVVLGAASGILVQGSGMAVIIIGWTVLAALWLSAWWSRRA